MYVHRKNAQSLKRILGYSKFYNMERQKRESVYSILSKILKLKFHIELKDSGISFNQIYKMLNLETGKECYLLQLNESEIRFVTTRDFVIHFSIYLQNNIEKLVKEYNRLIDIEHNDYTDDIAIEMKYKELDFKKMKQSELLDKMIEFKDRFQ